MSRAINLPSYAPEAVYPSLDFSRY